MKTLGIIAEYNPFHNGHQYQIEEARKQCDAECVIAVMSGNFVQRGEPAIVDKWKRAEAAINHGVDLVIELPYFYATQSASQFAKGGVEALKLAGVDYISFGSECGNLENLLDIADTPVNPDHIHIAMQNGVSFPKAYSLLTSAMYPNDILAVSYLKNIRDTDIKPIPIQRTTHYTDPDIKETCSALAIRKALKNNESLEHSTCMEDVLKESELAYLEMYYPYLRTILATSPRNRLSEIFLVSEGIENHLKKNAQECADFDTFLKACTNYRYTASRIRRTCLQIMMQFTKYEASRLPKYDCLRILAFNDTGRQWLHEKRKEEVHIASRFADVPFPWREVEFRSTLLYTSVLSEEERKRIIDNEIRGAHYVKKVD